MAVAQGHTRCLCVRGLNLQRGGLTPGECGDASLCVCWGCHNKGPQTVKLRQNYRTLFPYGSGGWKLEIKVLAGLVCPEASLLGL